MSFLAPSTSTSCTPQTVLASFTLSLLKGVAVKPVFTAKKVNKKT